jgi:hypothetical protein
MRTTAASMPSADVPDMSRRGRGDSRRGAAPRNWPQFQPELQRAG